jgi:hypothetical protein
MIDDGDRFELAVEMSSGEEMAMCLRVHGRGSRYICRVHTWFIAFDAMYSTSVLFKACFDASDRLVRGGVSGSNAVVLCASMPASRLAPRARASV